MVQRVEAQGQLFCSGQTPRRVSFSSLLTLPTGLPGQTLSSAKPCLPCENMPPCSLFRRYLDASCSADRLQLSRRTQPDSDFVLSSSAPSFCSSYRAGTGAVIAPTGVASDVKEPFAVCSPA